MIAIPFPLIVGIFVLVVLAFVLGGMHADAVAARGNRKFFSRITGEFIGPERRRTP